MHDQNVYILTMKENSFRRHHTFPKTKINKLMSYLQLVSNEQNALVFQASFNTMLKNMFSNLIIN